MPKPKTCEKLKKPVNRWITFVREEQCKTKQPYNEIIRSDDVKRKYKKKYPDANINLKSAPKKKNG